MNVFKFNFYVLPRNKSIEPYFYFHECHFSDDSRVGYLDFLEEAVSSCDDNFLKKYGFDEEFDLFIHFGDVFDYLGFIDSYYCMVSDSYDFKNHFMGDVGTR